MVPLFLDLQVTRSDDKDNNFLREAANELERMAEQHDAGDRGPPLTNQHALICMKIMYK